MIAPEEAFSDNPAGNRPEEMDHMYGDVPPTAARLALYAVPC
jgi:hypothetical protein